MWIKRDPEKAVSTLQNRLYQAIDLTAGGIDESMNENELVLKFRSIEAKLQELKSHLSGHKRWEDTVVDEFNQLRLHIYKILSLAKNKADDANKAVDARQHANIIKDDLQLVERKLEELNHGLRPMFPGKSDSESLQKRTPFKEAAERKVLKEWKEQEVERIILESSAMLNLQASYHNLERLDLKLCFLFLSVFPEDAVIKKRPLIYWWIGEGLITAKNKTAEEEGESVFQELIELDLIEPYYEKPDKPSPVINACRMHPWIRHMAISLAQKADLFSFDSSGTPSSDNSRRACLVLGSHNSSGVSTPNEENLLTVFNVSEQYLNINLDWLQKLKKVAVLQLGRWHNSPVHHIEVESEVFLKGLLALKHLKYLCLRGISLITTLPPSIGELCRLEILDLKACHNLEELPSEIGSLIRLTHLDASDCPFLESMPKELQKLTRLQVLKGFVIGNSRKSHCKIADLADLKELRRLSICIGNEAEVKKGAFTNLNDMGKLRCLTIWWGVKLSLEPPRVKSDEKYPKAAFLTDLSLPPGLEKLDLRGFPQPNPPQGLKPDSLKKLKRLYVRGGKLEKLDNGEKDDIKWKVEILRLKYLKDFKLDWKSLKLTFPKLDYLDAKCDQIGDKKEEEYEEDFVLTSRIEIEKYYKEKENSEEEEKYKKNVMPSENENHGEKSLKKDNFAEVALINKGKGKALTSEIMIDQASSSYDHSSQ